MVEALFLKDLVLSIFDISFSKIEILARYFFFLQAIKSLSGGGLACEVRQDSNIEGHNFHFSCRHAGS